MKVYLEPSTSRTRAQVSAIYCRRSLPMDLATSIPVSFAELYILNFMCNESDKNASLRLVRVTRAFKIARMLKVAPHVVAAL